MVGNGIQQGGREEEEDGPEATTGQQLIDLCTSDSGDFVYCDVHPHSMSCHVLQCDEDEDESGDEPGKPKIAGPSLQPIGGFTFTTEGSVGRTDKLSDGAENCTQVYQFLALIGTNLWMSRAECVALSRIWIPVQEYWKSFGFIASPLSMLLPTFSALNRAHY